MNIHKNARLTLWGREEAVRRVTQLGQSARHVARALYTTDATVRKWVARAAAGEGFTDRSSRPQHSPQATPPALVLRIKVLRQQRRTCGEIAALVAVSRATIARVVRRCGWARLHVLELPPTSRRYERAVPGELLPWTPRSWAALSAPGIGSPAIGGIRSMARGWEFGHMAFDDASRVAVGEVLPDERGGTAAGFLRRTVRGLQHLGVRVAAVMTDNGSCYRSRRFRAVCRRLGIRHLFTRPTRRARTARSSASSRPPCSSGPTRGSTVTPTSAGMNCSAGSTTTTGIVLIRVSAADPR
jgi:transposase